MNTEQLLDIAVKLRDANYLILDAVGIAERAGDAALAADLKEITGLIILRLMFIEHKRTQL
jgi:hypothetical protein